jgi:amino acid transporter
MRRYNLFLLLSGLVSLVANVLAIASYFNADGLLAEWRLDPGLLAAGSLLTLAYALTVWSVWAWKRVRGSLNEKEARRRAHFLLTALAALPALTLWLYLLTGALFGWPLDSLQRWMIALGLAWFFTPFAALGLMVLGEVLGPLLAAKQQESDQSSSSPPPPSASRPEG